MSLQGLTTGVAVVAVLVVLAAAAPTKAGSDFVTLGSGNVGDPDDGGRNPQFFTFTLPSGYRQSDAVLLFEAHGSEHNHNEIYINPRIPTCTNDGDEDVNRLRSIGYVNEHDANSNATREFYTNTKVFSGNKLQAGIDCSTDLDCPNSVFCQAHVCSNRFMFCARTQSGDVSGNVDNFFIRNMTLFYKTP